MKKIIFYCLLFFTIGLLNEGISANDIVVNHIDQVLEHQNKFINIFNLDSAKETLANDLEILKIKPASGANFLPIIQLDQLAQKLNLNGIEEFKQRYGEKVYNEIVDYLNKYDYEKAKQLFMTLVPKPLSIFQHFKQQASNYVVGSLKDLYQHPIKYALLFTVAVQFLRIEQSKLIERQANYCLQNYEKIKPLINSEDVGKLASLLNEGTYSLYSRIRAFIYSFSFEQIKYVKDLVGKIVSETFGLNFDDWSTGISFAETIRNEMQKPQDRHFVFLINYKMWTNILLSTGTLIAIFRKLETLQSQKTAQYIIDHKSLFATIVNYSKALDNFLQGKINKHELIRTISFDEPIDQFIDRNESRFQTSDWNKIAQYHLFINKKILINELKKANRGILYQLANLIPGGEAFATTFNNLRMRA